MKYIQKVILNNFQSHKYTEIEFDNALNIVVGPSDSGKTAILRGIRWALFNEPSGDYFIREGENECSVEIIFNDSTRIKRFRSKSKNIYYLYDNLNNEIKFEGFGTSVPEEIYNSTGIKKILIDSDVSKSINISEQLEGAFLLSERASTRANSIGRLVGVNIIDDALRDSLRDSRNLSNDKRNIDEKILDLEKELASYEYLDDLKKRVEKIEALRKEILSKEELLNKYKNLLNKYKVISKETVVLNHTLDRLSNTENLLVLSNTISEKITRYKDLKKANIKLTNISNNKKYNNNIVNILRHTNVIEASIDKINYLTEIIDKLIKYQLKNQNIRSEINNLKLTVSKLDSIEIAIEKSNKIDIHLQSLKELSLIYERYYSTRKRLAVGISYVERLKAIDNILNIFNNLNDKYERFISLNKLFNDYNKLNNEIESVRKNVNIFSKEIEKCVHEYKELLQKLEICPLCLSTIDEDKIGHIISHYI